MWIVESANIMRRAVKYESLRLCEDCVCTMQQIQVPALSSPSILFLCQASRKRKTGVIILQTPLHFKLTLVPKTSSADFIHGNCVLINYNANEL